jgi:hypothetical protein
MTMYDSPEQTDAAFRKFLLELRMEQAPQPPHRAVATPSGAAYGAPITAEQAARNRTVLLDALGESAVDEPVRLRRVS